MYRKVALQKQAFDLSTEIELLKSSIGVQGARVIFTGSVRADDGVQALFLEHYPGMTEAALENIASSAADRWPLQGLVLIHRIGELLPGSDIVLVVTASTHRRAAFEANTALADYLKTQVPLWKRETGAGIDRWVESSTEDKAAARFWLD